MLSTILTRLGLCAMRRRTNVGTIFTNWGSASAVNAKEAAAVDLVGLVDQVCSAAVSHNHVGSGFELIQDVHHTTVKEVLFLQGGPIHNYFNAFGFNALYDALNA